VQIFYWCAAIAETTIIVAQLGPPSIPSQLAISTLALGGGLPTICLTPSLAIGSILVASGALLRLQCYYALGKYFTFETGIIRNHRLITTGPYNHIRHPSYTGALLVYFGLLLYYGSPGSWFMECLAKGSIAGSIFCAIYLFAISLVIAGLLSRISKEDEGLKHEFGQEWEVWVARVPYVLIPGVY
jgi:protein-S-isoprenylcysteine O-methyltransferase Ste14